MSKQRLDQLVVERGWAQSREQAQRMIRAGGVRVEGRTADKPGHAYASDIAIEVPTPPRFVSRGGDKLEAAMVHFDIEVTGLVCADIGASTGGFTDCLLQRGAARVYAVDVGNTQLHARLQADPRVVVMDHCNARQLRPGDFPEAPAFAAVDCSFISLEKILPAVVSALAPGARLVTLIKPQFEAGREEIARGGVVRDPAVHEAVVARIRAFGTETVGLAWTGCCPSPLKGPAGNTEFLAYWRRP